jgi:hypothetical protein
MSEDNKKKHFYVYYSYEPWGRGYIGKRECECLPEEDIKYFGSYGDKTFKPTKKIILETFDSKENALEAERLLHKFYNVKDNSHFANRANQSSSRAYKALKISDEDFCRNFKKIVEESTSYSQVIKKLNLVVNGSSLVRIKNYINFLNLNTSHFTASNWNSGIISDEDLKIWHCKTKYKVISPNNETFIITNLKKFCIENNLSRTQVRAVINKKLKQHRGWIIYKL